MCIRDRSSPGHERRALVAFASSVPNDASQGVDKGAQMAWSWVRVSTATSPKLRNCMGADTSAGKAKECVTAIVTAAGGAFEHDGEVGKIDFEGNGRWARVRFW